MLQHEQLHATFDRTLVLQGKALCSRRLSQLQPTIALVA
jgi:hypothetical protein